MFSKSEVKADISYSSHLPIIVAKPKRSISTENCGLYKDLGSLNSAMFSLFVSNLIPHLRVRYTDTDIFMLYYIIILAS